MRRRLAHRAVKAIAPDAWVVDDTGFAKFGTASPGVARQYSGTLGKVGNCQIAVSVHAVTDAASCPLNWRLFLPAGWDDAEAASPEAAAVIRTRRARAAIPDGVRHRPKWALALDMLDELAGWGLNPPVVADAGYGTNADFRAGITARGGHYACQVQGDLTAYPAEATAELKPYSGRGPHPKPRYRTKPVGLRQHAVTAGPDATVEICWRNGSRAPLTSRFLVLRVRPAGRRPPLRPTSCAVSGPGPSPRRGRNAFLAPTLVGEVRRPDTSLWPRVPTTAPRPGTPSSSATLAVQLMGIIACHHRAAEWGHNGVELAAHDLLQLLDTTRATAVRTAAPGR